MRVILDMWQREWLHNVLIDEDFDDQFITFLLKEEKQPDMLRVIRNQLVGKSHQIIIKFHERSFLN